MISYNGQLKEVNYNIERKRSYSKKNGTKITNYCNDILTFDIEVTSAWLENGKVIGYSTGKSNDYWNSLTPLALPYIWQFSFNDKVYYGRELRDFEKILEDLNAEYKIVIWVHNLSYEFHFLNNFLEWKTVFARTPHKPMKCVPLKYPNIEFRCSYMLTRLSLDAWGKQIGYHKATGDLDYEQIRTPLTELNEKELNYAEQDCLVVYHGIETYKKKYGNIRDIPLTQTGTVRRVVKNMLTSDKEYVKYIKKLVPKTTEEYLRLMKVFSGGYTHANRAYSGDVQYGHIEHYDFASSYPTVMICEKYPSTIWLYQFNKELPTPEECEDYAFILTLKFTKLECTTFNTYIQSSKSKIQNGRYDNGRVLTADTLEITLTEQDYLIIKECYKWENVEVLEKYRSVKRYLPKPFIDYILELYHNKTTLKGVDGMEELYMQSKQYINSLFGMSVTAIVQQTINFDGKDWLMEDLTPEYVQEKLDKLRMSYEREKRYFLSYSWGCWVTAYARRNLWKCILSCDEEVLYCDTDSIFVKGKHDFKWYNDEVTNKLKIASEIVGFDYEKTHPKTSKGVDKWLGIFEQEDSCNEFITLGAKRYVERRESDNKLHLTVSGINKEAVDLLKNDIENFVDGYNFDKDEKCVKKKLSTYLTDMPIVKFDDGYISTYKEGINLRRTGYLLSMTDEYKQLLRYTKISVSELDDHSIQRILNSFGTETEEEIQ